MLRSIRDITNYSVKAIDGPIGTGKDCLFDDRHWKLRHLVVDTGKWILGRKVLISPRQIIPSQEDGNENTFQVDLTKKHIEDCPKLESDEPASRQYEEAYAKYFNHRLYWLTTDVFHPTTTAVKADGIDQKQAFEQKMEEIADCHLRSANEVMNYQIEAKDGEFGGYVEDLIIEDTNWTILYIVIATRNWLPGRKLIIDRNWINEFDWKNQKATVGLSRDKIEKAPEFDPHQPINKDYLESVCDYFGNPRLTEKTKIEATTL